MIWHPEGVQIVEFLTESERLDAELISFLEERLDVAFTEADVRKLAAKGARLLERYRKTKD